MPVYVIAQLTITDRAAYSRYQERFMPVLSRFKGRLLAADETPTVLEGDWDRDKVILLSFLCQGGAPRMGRILRIPGNRQG